jgi:hypothetical protein
MSKRKLIPSLEDKENQEEPKPKNILFEFDFNNNTLNKNSISNEQTQIEEDLPKIVDDADLLLNFLNQNDSQIQEPNRFPDSVEIESPLTTKQQIKKILKEARDSDKKCYSNAHTTKSPIELGLLVKDFGDIAFPLTEPRAEELMATFTNASAPNSIEIDSDRIEITNNLFKKVLTKLLHAVCNKFKCESKIIFKLSKMILSKKDHATSKQMPQAKNEKAFATALIQLPSIFTGGCLNVYDCDDIRSFDFGSSKDRAFNSINYAAFFNSLEYELAEISSGYRTFLVYELIGDEAYVNISEFEAKMHRQLGLLNEIEYPMSMFLDWDYTSEELKAKGVEGLKDLDLIRYKLLKEASDRLPNKQLKFFIIEASLDVKYIKVDENQEDEFDIFPREFSGELGQELKIENIYASTGELYINNSSSYEAETWLIQNVINPNTKANKTDRVTNAKYWGDAVDEIDFIEGEGSKIFRKHFLTFWPSENEVKIFLRKDLKFCASHVLEAEYGCKIKEFIELMKKTPGVRTRINVEFDYLINKMLAALLAHGDLALTQDFIANIMVELKPENCDYLADLIKMFGWYDILRSACRIILPIKDKNLFSNCLLVQVNYLTKFFIYFFFTFPK